MRIYLCLLHVALLGQTATQDGNFVQKLQYNRGIYYTGNVSAGQLLTLFVKGLGTDGVARAEKYPTKELAGISATIQNGLEEPTNLHIAEVGVPIFCGSTSCDLTAVTVVIPISYTPKPWPTSASLMFPRIVFSKNGVPGYPSTYTWARGIHIFEQCDTILRDAFPRNPFCYPLVSRPDGSVVSERNFARPGETVTVYGTGFGLPTSSSRAAYWADFPENSGEPFPIAPQMGPVAGFFSFTLKLPEGPPPKQGAVERWGVTLFSGVSFIIRVSESDPAEPRRIYIDEVFATLNSLRPSQ
jgi:hypothetical protein